MPNTVPASATALPSASIIPFPLARHLADFDLSRQSMDKAFVAIHVAGQFIGMDDANVDRALTEMMEAFPDALTRMIQENGEVLQTLRQTTTFLAAMDLRIQAAAFRIIERSHADV